MRVVRVSKAMGWPVTGSLVAALSIGAPPAHGQLNGVPVWTPGLPNTAAPSTFLVAANVTSGDDFVGRDTRADWGVSAAYRRLLAEKLTLTGGLGILRRDVAADDRSWQPQAFASLAFNALHLRDAVGVYEAGLSPIAGLGYSELPDAANEQNFPLGVDLTGIRAMDGWFVEVWALPRWSWRRTELTGGELWQDGFGISGGITAGFAIGLSLQVAVDKTYLGAAADGSLALPATRPLAWSFGGRWTW